MRWIVVTLLLLVFIASAVQDRIDPDLARYGEGIVALCEKHGLAGRVAWVSDRDGNLEIYLMDLDESYPYRVTAFEGEDRYPALSPDGRYLAWVSEIAGQPDIYLMDLGESGRDRIWERLTDTPGVEGDLSWSSDGERVYYSSWEEADLDAVSLFVDPTELEPGILDEVSVLYYYDLERGGVERQSLEPGDYYWPCHVSGFGLVCGWRAWEGGAQAKLAYIHDALATGDLNTPGTEVVGPIRRYADDTLLVPYRDGDKLYYARQVPLTGEIILSWYIEGGDRLNAVPDPADAESGWYLCQTAFEGDPSSEILLVGGLTSSWITESVYLTHNDCYDGEPTWAVFGGECIND